MKMEQESGVGKLSRDPREESERNRALSGKGIEKMVRTSVFTPKNMVWSLVQFAMEAGG
jgi:hypothetical protein